MTTPAQARLAEAHRALAELAEVLRAEGVRSYEDLVDNLVRMAAEPTDEAAAAERLATLRTRYAELSEHRDGLDEVYLPRPDWDEQRRASLHLDALREAVRRTLAPGQSG